jgi:hypothetical protein
MIILPAIIEGISTRKDRTLKIVLGTNELSPEKAGDLFQLNNAYCFCALQKDEFKETEKKTIESLKSDYNDTGKSLSQRLRGVLFVNYQQNNEGFKDSDSYYTSKMESIIDFYKKQLE